MYSNLTSVSEFNNNEITLIKLPSTIESIGSYAFADNNLCGELDFSGTNLISVDYQAFYQNQITSVKFPITIESIEYEAFVYNKLESVTFYGRSDLTGISIASSVWNNAWAENYSYDNSIFFITEE